MRIIQIVAIWIVTIPAFGQFEVFPKYKFVTKDSLHITLGQDVKTIKVKSDTIYVRIDSKDYAFAARQSFGDLKFSYPTYIADFDSKYDMEIMSWDIETINPDDVTFKISYTRRYKKQGGQKGKYFVNDNYKINKDDLEGIYIGGLEKQELRKVNLINIGLGLIVIVAVIIGTR
jgi:hypothetical protein